MRFTSLIFVIFFLIVYVAFWSSRRTRLPLLFVASLAFYAAWSVVFALHFLAIIAVSHILIHHINVARRASRSNRSRGYLWAVLAINFGNLFFFKYAFAVVELLFDLGFFPSARFSSAGPDGAGDGARATWPGFALVLPLAISFYTFQICAYAIDVWRGLPAITGDADVAGDGMETADEPGFLKFAVFILFFPQLVAGPIMRYHEFFGQLARLERLEPRFEQITTGIFLLIQGFTKKILIADNLAPATAAILFHPEQYDWQSCIAAMAGFTAQIYCDFSGYTDIARGLGKLLGLELPENFFGPYLSESFRAFWRNWHRTLTTWLRDYVYIPLGGNRVTVWRRHVNTMIVLISIGLWHGAGYNFFVLGALNGLYLIGEETLSGFARARASRITRGLDSPLILKIGSLFTRCAGGVITLTYVTVAMVMMVTPDFSTTLALYGRAFGFDALASDYAQTAMTAMRHPAFEQLWGGYALALLLNVFQKMRDRWFRITSDDAANTQWLFASRARRVAVLGGLWLLAFLFLIALGRFAPSSNDFFYFQF